MKLPQLALAAALGLAHAASAFAGDAHEHMHEQAHEHAASVHAGMAMSEGEVKKVDPQAGKIVIKHGPLQNLGMPPMTMAFAVKDPAMLAGVKAGDKIRFTADKVGAAYTVMQLETVK